MNLGIEGRAALVTGASKGLGRACAEALAAEGADLVIVARSEGPIKAAALSIAQRTGVKVIPVVADIATPKGRDLAFAAAQQLRHGRYAGYDIVINNCGGPPTGDFRDWDLEVWHHHLEVQMLTPIEVMRATVDGMIERRWGRIINVTSTTVKAPVSYLGLSNGTRAGLTGFVAGLSRDVAPHGVTINSLLPGTFSTGRLYSNMVVGAARAGMDIESFADNRRRSIPCRRFGDAEEFGAMCAFLCSRQAGYITGQNLLIDRGAFTGVY